MLETAGDVRSARRLARFPRFRENPQLGSGAPRYCAILTRTLAHTFRGGGLKQHMVFEAHTHTHTHSFIDNVTQDRTKPGLFPLLIDCDMFLEARLPGAQSHGFKPSMV